MALIAACEQGHLHVIQFLRDSFGLGTDDARAQDNRALIFACEKGHLEVVRYLHKSFGLGTNDALENDNKT